MKKTLLAVVLVLAVPACAVNSVEGDAARVHDTSEEGCPGFMESCMLECLNGDCPSQTFSDNTVYQAPCADVCDCFDDNACTTDTCVDSKCQNVPADGGCGETVGWCRGTWCCTSETTCFQAYDIGSVCDLDG